MDQLTIQNNMIFCGTRLFIPPRLRNRVFELCHNENHSGINSTLQRIQLSAWWPGMASYVHDMVSHCDICSKIRSKTARTVDTWPEAAPFQRLHMDWAYVKDIGNVLIIVDAATGWIEAFPMKDRSSKSVIHCLRTVFTRFGVAETLVSDNAQEFISDEVNEWLKIQGTNKMESPPYFSRANGSAERAVQTIKAALQAWKESTVHVDFVAYLQKLLLHHRVSTCSRGKSPAELVFGRKLRIPIMSNHQQGDEIWYKPMNKSPTIRSTYVMTKGKNTSWILNDQRLTLVSNNQIASAPLPLTEDEHTTIVNNEDKTDIMQGCGSMENETKEKNTDEDYKIKENVIADGNGIDVSELRNEEANNNLRRSGRQKFKVERYGFP
jgi:hypothetical protein